MTEKLDLREACLRASDALAHSNVQAIRGLHVGNEQDSLRVTGRVDSYYHKQLALETVRSVSHGMPILNRVDVF